MLTDCRWQCKLEQPLWRTVRKVLTKLELKLPSDPAVLFQVYPWEEISLSEISVLSCMLLINRIILKDYIFLWGKCYAYGVYPI